jgi:hypothetical protein
VQADGRQPDVSNFLKRLKSDFAPELTVRSGRGFQLIEGHGQQVQIARGE